MAARRETLYIFDSNALIDLFRRMYPRETFPALWKDLESLCDRGCLVIPEEVRAELESLDDGLLGWVRDRPSIVCHLDDPQVTYVRAVLTQYPNLVRTKRPNPQADAFVISLALAKQAEENARFDDMRKDVVVVSQEKRDGDPSLKRKIPNACEFFSIPCLNLLAFFSREDWKYDK